MAGNAEVRVLVNCTLCRGAFGGTSGDSSHRRGGFSQPGEVTVIREPSGRRAWLLQVVLAAAVRAYISSFGMFFIVL